MDIPLPQEELENVAPGVFYEESQKRLKPSNLETIPVKHSKRKFPVTQFAFKRVTNLEEAAEFLDVAILDALQLKTGKERNLGLNEKCLLHLAIPGPHILIKACYEESERGMTPEEMDAKPNTSPDALPSHIIQSVVLGERMVIAISGTDETHRQGGLLTKAAELDRKLKRLVPGLLPEVEKFQREALEDLIHSESIKTDNDSDTESFVVVDDGNTGYEIPEEDASSKAGVLSWKVYSTLNSISDPESLNELLNCIVNFERSCSVGKNPPVKWNLHPLENPHGIPSTNPATSALLEKRLKEVGRYYDDIISAKKKLSVQQRHGKQRKITIGSTTDLNEVISDLWEKLKQSISNLDIMISSDQKIDILENYVDEYTDLLQQCPQDSFSSYIDETGAEFRSMKLEVLQEEKWNDLRKQGWSLKDIQAQDMREKQKVDERVRRCHPQEFQDPIPKGPDDICVLLLGAGGVGRSTLGNLLLGKRRFMTSTSIQTQTQYPELGNARNAAWKQNVWVLDTPPIPSEPYSYFHPHDHSRWLSICQETLGDRNLHAILLVLDAHNSALPPQLESGLFKTLREQGSEICKYIIVVWTRVDIMEKSYGSHPSIQDMDNRTLHQDLRQLLYEVQGRCVLVDPMAASQYEKLEYQRVIIKMVNHIWNQEQKPLPVDDILNKMHQSESICPSCTLL